MIYVIQAGERDLFKIGHAAGDSFIGATQRRKELQIGCPDELTIVAAFAGDKSTEREWHEALAEFRVRGEWFSRCRAIEDLIERHPVRDGMAKSMGDGRRRCVCVVALPYDLVLRLDRARGDASLSDLAASALEPYAALSPGWNRCMRMDNWNLKLPV